MGGVSGGSIALLVGVAPRQRQDDQQHDEKREGEVHGQEAAAGFEAGAEP